MKQDYHHRRPYTWKHTTNYVRTNYIFLSYITLLLLTYALGYFCGTSSKQITPIVKTELISATSCPPVTSSVLTDKNNDHNVFGSQCSDLVHPDSTRSVIIERVFNGTSPYINFPPPHASHLLKSKRLKGWGSNGAVFRNLIEKVRPKIIIEVGSFLGASATHMAQLTLQLGIKSQILCVDDFRGWPGFTDKVNYVPSLHGDVLLLYQFMQNVVSLNLTDLIMPVPFSTGSALGKLCEWGVLADLIEVDAGHDFHSAWTDINLAYKLLRPGGIMFGHDYFTGYDNKGVRRAVDLFAKVHGFKVTTDGQHWVLVDH